MLPCKFPQNTIPAKEGGLTFLGHSWLGAFILQVHAVHLTSVQNVCTPGLWIMTLNVHAHLLSKSLDEGNDPNRESHQGHAADHFLADLKVLSGLSQTFREP